MTIRHGDPMPRPSRRKDILDTTESLMRQYGFDGFSIRDVADTVGVRTSAVHYHFATKGDLAEAVTRRYRESFFETIGEPGAPDALDTLIHSFRTALVDAQAVCLCGVLATEVAALPAGPREETAAFFKRLVEWVDAALAAVGTPSRSGAMAWVSVLEGAMLLSRALDDIAAFDAAVGGLRDPSSQ